MSSGVPIKPQFTRQRKRTLSRAKHRGKSSRNSHDTRPITVMLVLVFRSRWARRKALPWFRSRLDCKRLLVHMHVTPYKHAYAHACNASETMCVHVWSVISVVPIQETTATRWVHTHVHGIWRKCVRIQSANKTDTQYTRSRPKDHANVYCVSDDTLTARFWQWSFLTQMCYLSDLYTYSKNACVRMTLRIECISTLSST